MPHRRLNRNTSATERGVVWDSESRMTGGSLFDRLVLDEEDLDLPVAEHDVDARVRSIQRNLERILNVHAGNASSAPALGLENFNDGTITTGDIARNMMAMIRTCILEYEPRITDARVEIFSDSDDPLTLRFSILAEVPVANRAEQIRFDMAMRDRRIRRL